MLMLMCSITKKNLIQQLHYDNGDIRKVLKFQERRKDYKVGYNAKCIKGVLTLCDITYKV